MSNSTRRRGATPEHSNSNSFVDGFEDEKPMSNSHGQHRSASETPLLSTSSSLSSSSPRFPRSRPAEYKNKGHDNRSSGGGLGLIPVLILATICGSMTYFANPIDRGIRYYRTLHGLEPPMSAVKQPTATATTAITSVSTVATTATSLVSVATTAAESAKMTTGNSMTAKSDSDGESAVQEFEVNPKFAPAPWQRLPLPKSVPSAQIVFDEPELFKNSPADWEKSQTDYQWEPLIQVPEQPIPNARRILHGIFAGKRGMNIIDENDPSHPLAKCPPTTQIKLHVPDMEAAATAGKKPAAAPYWLIQTFGDDGQPKTTGGDEFYITFTDQGMQPDPNDDYGLIEKSTAVGFTEDFNNGWYKVTFVSSFMNLPGWRVKQATGWGYLGVHFMYTCGMGNMPPPEKTPWIFGGAIASKYMVKNVVPPKIFHPWADHNVNPDTGGKALHLENSYDVIATVGDSVMDQWSEKSHKTTRKGKFQMPLFAGSVQQFIERIATDYGESLNRALPPSNERVALIIGSSTWDICDSPDGQTADWYDHRQALRTLVKTVKETYPKVDLYWKSATALHIHVPVMNVVQKAVTFTMEDYNHPDFSEPLTHRLRYMSDSRVRNLYLAQMEIMKEFNVPVLDMYLMTYVSADHLRPGDGRHYKHWFNEVTMKHYGGSWPGRY